MFEFEGVTSALSPVEASVPLSMPGMYEYSSIFCEIFVSCAKSLI